MNYLVVLVTLGLTTAIKARKTSTDDLEQLLLDILSNKTNIEDSPEISSLTGKECFGSAPDTPNFLTTGRRISDAKCQEYHWILQQKEIETRDIEKLKHSRFDGKRYTFLPRTNSIFGENHLLIQPSARLGRIYLIREIKKGTVPEIFFLINSPVIFGGSPAAAGEFPHMGAIGWQSKNQSKPWVFKCGSTLISENYVLTAAHCSRLALRFTTDIADAMPKIVRFGVENIEENTFNVNGEPIDIKIKRIIRHPNYNAPKKYYDIALMELETKVKFDLNIIPACLWSYTQTTALGNKFALTGWGYTEEGHTSEVLQVAYVDILDSGTCDELLHKKRNRNWQGFSEHQICAGNLTGGVDSCQGDSGGPIQVKMGRNNLTDASIHMVIGVTSFGIRCAKKGIPGIYTRVSSFIDWIEEIVWGNQLNNTKTLDGRKRPSRKH